MQKMTIKRKRIWTFGLFAAVFALVLTFAACGGGGGGAAAEVAANVDNTVIADYVYVPTFIDLPQVDGHIDGTFAHGDRVYYYFVEHDNPPEGVNWETWVPDPPRIVVASVAADGSDPRQVVIPMDGDGSSARVTGMRVTAGGNYAMILMNHTWDGVTSGFSVIYAEYSPAGELVFSEELEHIVPQGTSWFHIEDTIFLEDGNIVLLGSGDRGSIVTLLGEDRSLRGQMEQDWIRSLTQTADGRILVLDMEFEGDTFREVLREVDFATGDWGESFSLSSVNIRNLYPARSGDPFDLLLSDDNHLYGYNLETGEQTRLLNWIESGVAASHFAMDFLADGQFAILVSDWRADDWTSELIVLNRTARADLPVREIITLGGFSLWGDVRNQVVAFNRASQTHQINVIDYMMYSTQDDWGAGQTRFLAELAAGQGPDIIWGNHMMLAPLLERGILADLNPYIAADPELNRSDFHPNIMDALETVDGSLPLIANGFSIQTMVGMAEAVEHIQSWSLADALAVIEQTPDAELEFIFGEWMTGETFLATMLMTAGDDFIDWANGTVNLDSEAFINLLEISARLPDQWGREGMMRGGFHDFVSAQTRMRRGEQLLDMAYIWSAMDLQMYTGVLGEVRALGVPTQNGGAHVIQPRDGMGINISSDHQDAAWGFIRRFLLADAHVDWSFPLRIDRFEEMIEEASTPIFWTDEDGNEIEQSRGGVGFDDLMIELYALSEDEANLIREIVSTASLLARFDETVTEMIQEEVLPFFAGDRSAADTARILQNRIQTYLNERR